MKRIAVAVIGEGITEKYYIESLKGLSPFSVLPKSLDRKASNLKALEKQIKECVSDGYDYLFCLIDMDGKQQGKAKTDYLNLKSKYHNKILGNKKKGIQCNVRFIETERCTELWFLYHFTASPITREFTSYNMLERELHKYRPQYEKTESYFKRVGNLYDELTKNGSPTGSLQTAICNSERSILSKEKDGRVYTYSEMHLFLKEVGIE